MCRSSKITNFIRSKAILQVLQGDIVVIDSGLHK